jgi:hypothetical protein
MLGARMEFSLPASCFLFQAYPPQLLLKIGHTREPESKGLLKDSLFGHEAIGKFILSYRIAKIRAVIIWLQYHLQKEIYMDIFFHDPEDMPVPPDEVKIREFKAEAYPDGKRVKVYLEVTPFLQKPSGEVYILNSQNQAVANVSIIETVTSKMEMTMHIRESTPNPPYKIKAEIFYDAELPEATLDGPAEDYELPERTKVDELEIPLEL